jgi:tetratricopeptide (TPR) repeat protein
LKIILLLFFLYSCDFSPKLHRDILKAQNLLIEQKYKEAAFTYEEILVGLPSGELKEKVHLQLGDIYSIHLEDFKKGIHYYHKIVTSSDDPLWVVKAQEKIGDLYFSFLKQFDKAAFFYEGLVKVVPKLQNFDFYQFRLALSYMEIEEYEKVLSILKTIRKDPLHKYFVSSYYYLGLTYFNTKKMDQAIKIWEEYIQREKRRDRIIQTRFLMANAYESMENLSKAYSIYYSLLGEYPNTKVLQNRLNSVYSRKVAKKR